MVRYSSASTRDREPIVRERSNRIIRWVKNIVNYVDSPDPEEIYSAVCGAVALYLPSANPVVLGTWYALDEMLDDRGGCLEELPEPVPRLALHRVKFQ